MILHVVRHAESLANVNRSTVIDCDLTEVGLGQAVAVANELHRLGIDRVLSSPYRRTLCTAHAIAEKAGVPLEVMPDLHEHHVSAFPADWPLMTRSELIVNFAGLLLPEDFRDHGWHTPPETDAAVYERMGRALTAIEERYTVGNPRLVLVTHGSPTSKFVQAFVGGNRADVAIANASITTLEIVGGKRQVKVVNRVDHLRDVQAIAPVAPPLQPVLL